MNSVTLEELEARLQAQDVEVAHLEELAEAIPSGVMLPRTVLKDIEDATELESSRHVSLATVPLFSLRA